MSAPQSPRCPRSRKYPGLCGGLREARVDKKKKLNLVHYCVKILLTTVIMNMMTVCFLTRDDYEYGFEYAYDHDHAYGHDYGH